MNDNELTELAQRLVELREEKRYLEGQIEEVAARIAEAVGEGEKRTVGDVELRITVAKPGMRIAHPEDVPDEFRSSLPDRKRLQDHIASTGEVPPGVEVTEGRPTVYAKSKKA